MVRTLHCKRSGQGFEKCQTMDTCGYLVDHQTVDTIVWVRIWYYSVKKCSRNILYAYRVQSVILVVYVGTSHGRDGNRS